MSSGHEAGPRFEAFQSQPDNAFTELKVMKARLSAVDLAIAKLQEKANACAGPDTEGPDSSSLLAHLRPMLIDTQSAQFGTCPHCYAAMHLSSLRTHMASSCPSLEMTCPETGCGATFPSTELRQHQQNECRVLQHRRQLIQQAQQRKQDKIDAARAAAEQAKAARVSALSYAAASIYDEYEYDADRIRPLSAEAAGPEQEEPAPTYSCPACGEVMLFSRKHAHALTCRLRLVYCPNRPFGCEAEMALAGVQAHLTGGGCAVERRKSDMIARCNKRKEPVRCVGCGDFFPLRDLRQHETELCANRKVACRNAHLGCTVTMRAKMLKAHEEADNTKARVRYCLYLGGIGASIALNEDDVPAPWTTEYWLYRPSAQESAKQYLRAALLLGPPLVDAFMHQHLAKDHVDAVTALLSDKRLQLSPEEREASMELLAEAVELLEDAALAAVAACKTLGCALGAAQQAMTEFLPARFRVSDCPFPYVTHTPQPPPPGQQSGRGVEFDKASLRAQPPGTPSLDLRDKEVKVSREGSRGGSRAKSRAGSRGKSAEGGAEKNKEGNDEKHEEEDEEKNAPVGEEAGYEEEESQERESGVEGGEDGSVVEVDVAEDGAAEGTEATAEINGTGAGTMDQGVQDATLPTVPRTPGAPDPESATPSPDRPPEEAPEPSLPLPPWSPPVSAPYLSATAQLLRLPSLCRPLPPSPEDSEARSVAYTPYTPYTAATSVAVASLYDKTSIPPPALFLLQGLSIGRRGGAGQGAISALGYHTQLTWPEWWLVSALLADGLWRDRATLKAVMQASGLMGRAKKDKRDAEREEAEAAAAAAATAAEGTKGKVLTEGEKLAQEEAKRQEEERRRLEEEKEAKALKKEKDRLRREAKMKKGQLEAVAQQQEEEEAAAGAGAGPATEDANQDTQDTAAEDAKKERQRAEREARQRARESRKHIKDRLLEVERAFVGADLLGSCSTAGPSGLANKLCLEMAPHPASWKERLDKENRFAAAAAAQNVDKKKKDGKDDGLLMDPRDNALPGRMGVVLAECPQGGPGCFSFASGVPREQWVHLALVSSPEPFSRLVLYLDGVMRGALKDCGIPLPMASICAPSPLSLSAAFLDVRLWSKVRSQQEVQMGKSRLVTLEERVVEKAGAAGGKKGPKGKEPPPRAEPPPALAPGQPDLSSRGLIAWFAFEEGAGATRILDVTESRYPSALSRNLVPLPLLPPKIPDPPTLGGASAAAQSMQGQESGKAGEAAGGPSLPRSAAGGSRGRKPPTPDYVSLPLDSMPAAADAPPPASPPRPSPSRPQNVGLGAGGERSSTAQALKAQLAQAYRATPWYWLDADGLPLPNSPPPRPGEDTPLPVPAFSSRGVCPYELKRLRLAQKGRQLYKEMACPLGCGELTTRKDARFHALYSCTHRVVPCRFAPECPGSYRLFERTLHEAKGPAAPQCLHTQALVAFWRTADYGNELAACEHCALEVRRKHLAAHLLKDCPHRLVECPHPSCAREVQFHALDAHLRLDCPFQRDRAFLVTRARERVGYPRPWAIEVPYFGEERGRSPTKKERLEFDDSSSGSDREADAEE